MNIYDFDGTIYKGDSSIDFFLYCLQKNPKIIKCIFKQAGGFLKYKQKKISKNEFKEAFFCYLQHIDVEKMLEGFWNEHESKIFDWYKEQQREDDIIISASPEFQLRPICERLGIKHLIATKTNPKTGLFDGDNCHGAEKVRRLQEELGVTHCDNFYSDAQSDAPLAKIADNAFLVKSDGSREPWVFQHA